MEYFEKTSPEQFRFVDFYRYRQKQDDFTRSFRDESGNLWRCLKLLVKDGTPQVKENAVRLQKSFEASVCFLYLWYTSCRQVWGLLLKSREGVTYFHDYGGGFNPLYGGFPSCFTVIVEVGVSFAVLRRGTYSHNYGRGFNLLYGGFPLW